VNSTPDSQPEISKSSSRSATLAPRKNPKNPSQNHRQSKRSPKVNWLGWFLGIGLSSSAIALVGWFGYKLESSLPTSVDDVTSYARPGTLTIKAANGEVLKEIGPTTHEKIEIDTVPKTLYQAFIASEDRRFYQHQGIDYRGIARAALTNVKTGSAAEGASTITQQLARIAFLNQEKRIWRKLREMRIASKIENSLEKSEILETYLNLVYLGSGSYGVADAAWIYFGKSPQKLNLSEVATLAGIIPAPSVYSPFTNLDLAKERRNIVLTRMEQQGFISASAAFKAKASDLITNRREPKRLHRQADYFTNYIEQELPKYINQEVLQAGGVVVETTLNPKWQKAAETTVKYGLDNYGKWQEFKQGALVALDSHQGEIRAMVGGQDFGDNQYNRVTQAQRQPGSTFKTFVYTTAIAAGFSPYQSYLDAQYFVDDYQPNNYNHQYRDYYVSIYDALAASINTVAVRTMVDVGWNPTLKIAHLMGIKSKLKPSYALALGSSEVNLLEITNAYSTLASKGIYQQSYGINRIRDRQGQEVYQAQFQPQVAVNRETAAMMSWMLQGVVNFGTAIPAQIGRQAAGKTGTSDKSRDLWYIGYIPQVTAGIWLGNDDNQPTKGSSGVAAEMWRKFMLEVIKDMPIEYFPLRPSLTERQTTISTEPLKPAHAYYKRQPVGTSAYVSTPRYYAPKPTPAPKYTPAPAIVTKPTPIPPQPKLTKFSDLKIPANHPINDPNRDWVKERLGRN
jgi:penicillin-binding protein 1A